MKLANLPRARRYDGTRRMILIKIMPARNTFRVDQAPPPSSIFNTHNPAALRIVTAAVELFASSFATLGCAQYHL